MDVRMTAEDPGPTIQTATTLNQVQDVEMDARTFQLDPTYSRLLATQDYASQHTKMIKSIEISQPNSRLCRLRLIALDRIMSFLTPPELLNLARTTTSFAQLLADPKSEFVWQQARANYYPVIPRPTASNWTESSYANLMFGGGECLYCTVEVKPKEKGVVIPDSFACRTWSCKRQSCMNRRRRKPRKSPIFTVSTFNPLDPRYKRYLKWLPYKEGRRSYMSRQNKEFIKKRITEAKKEYMKLRRHFSRKKLEQIYSLRAKTLPQVQKNAEAYSRWKHEYETWQPKEARRWENRIKYIAEKLQAKKLELLSTPTFTEFFTACCPINKPMGPDHFKMLHKLLDGELHAKRIYNRGVKVMGASKNPKSRKPMPIVPKNAKIVIPLPPYVPSGKTMLCVLCRTTKKFDWNGFRSHSIHKHNIHGDVKENVHWVDDINADIEEGQITEPYLSRMAKKRRIETSEQARARARDRDYALEEGELLEY